MRKTALVLGITSLVLLCASSAHAQACPERSDALILATIAVHEAGWYADDDMRWIHAVIARLADDWSVSFAEAACRHSRRLLTGRTSRPWASDLTESDDAPARWPTTIVACEEGVCEVRPHPPWSNYVERWRGRLALARRILAGRPISRDVLTWGGRIDFDPARRRRPLPDDVVWVEVFAGRNHFGRWVPVAEVGDPELDAEAPL